MQPSKSARLAIFLTVFVDLLGFGIVIPILPLYAQASPPRPTGWSGSTIRHGPDTIRASSGRGWAW